MRASVRMRVERPLDVLPELTTKRELVLNAGKRFKPANTPKLGTVRKNVLAGENTSAKSSVFPASSAAKTAKRMIAALFTAPTPAENASTEPTCAERSEWLHSKLPLGV